MKKHFLLQKRGIIALDMTLLLCFLIGLYFAYKQDVYLYTGSLNAIKILFTPFFLFIIAIILLDLLGRTRKLILRKISAEPFLQEFSIENHGDEIKKIILEKGKFSALDYWCLKRKQASQDFDEKSKLENQIKDKKRYDSLKSKFPKYIK